MRAHRRPRPPGYKRRAAVFIPASRHAEVSSDECSPCALRIITQLLIQSTFRTMGNANGAGPKRSPTSEDGHRHPEGNGSAVISATGDRETEAARQELRRMVNEAALAWSTSKETIKSVGDFSEHEKKMLQDSWKHLEQDIAQVGIIVFINLFESHPDLQTAFLPFTGMVLDDLKKSKLLREHALRVMGAVQRAVFRLHEPQKLDKFLRDLGHRHNKNGAKLEYIDYIGPQFLSAIRPSLAADWSPELERAWTLLLRYMGDTMKESMLAARQSTPPVVGGVPTPVPSPASPERGLLSAPAATD